MSSALAPAAAEALAGAVERGWPWEQHSTRWQRGRQPRRCLETLPSSSPECRGPVPAPCMHNGPSVPQAQKETLSEKVRGPGIHLTQGQEEHASPCLAESQAVPVLIPIHGSFQVLRKPPCASSLKGAAQERCIPSAKGSSVWLWGRKSTLPEQSKAFGSPSCWPCGVQMPQPGWAGELSKSWP